MPSVKSGLVLSISRNDNMGIIKEDNTQTEFIFFLDNLSSEQLRTLRPQVVVSFVRDESYEQFVASKVYPTPINHRKAI